MGFLQKGAKFLHTNRMTMILRRSALMELQKKVQGGPSIGGQGVDEVGARRFQFPESHGM